jgi:hypothetical protein
MEASKHFLSAVATNIYMMSSPFELQLLLNYSRVDALYPEALSI